MGKAGWQITTALCGSLALMMGALAFNTSRALDVANAQLRERHASTAQGSPADAASAPADAMTREEFNQQLAARVERESNAELLRDHPQITRCINGEMFVKLAGEWRNNGRC